MRRTEAGRYARWSAAAALLLATVTAVVYLHRGWARRVERRNAPPPAPVDVTRQSAGLTLKKFDQQNHIIYTVKASKSTEFKGRDSSVIEDVNVTVFGKNGDRHDILHSKSCEYGKDSGDILCAGDVQIDLLSAADAKATEGNPTAAAARATHIETRRVTFNPTSGLARTDQPATFRFPSGTANGTGLEYETDAGRARLLRNVHGVLLASAPGGGKKRADRPVKPGQEVRIAGTTMDFDRETRLVHLQGPAEADSDTERLTAGEMTLTLDEQFHSQTMVATAGMLGQKPQVVSHDTRDEMRLDGDVLTAHMAPEGWIAKIDAAGSVHGYRNSPKERDETCADSGTMDLWPSMNQPKELHLTGNVVVRTIPNTNLGARTLRTNAFLMEFAGAERDEANKPKYAETLAPGTVEWADPGNQNKPSSKMRLQGDRLALDFDPDGNAKQLRAQGNVSTEKSVIGHPLQTATSKSGVADLEEGGTWTQVDLRSDVRLTEADRSARAERAIFNHNDQTAALTGEAVARDATTETHAPRIVFAQETGNFQAEGGVRSTDLSARSGTVQLAPVPANIVSDHMEGNSKTGRALYTGHARLWQGNSVLEADSIELLRPTQILNAVGHVRGVFPQTTSSPTNGSKGAAPSRQAAKSAAKPDAGSATGQKMQLWHVTAGTLTYHDKESFAHLEETVVAQSADQRMRAPIMDVYFTRSTQPQGAAAQPVPPAGQTATAGAQQISRAVGVGGVIVEESDRKATAERGEYTAATGKFVMTGGDPTLYDAAQGTTKGRQLTFFLADDTIIVDSDNGSRTLTKHRVEK
jgi:lipopolysaccharide export system protein LptA